MSADTEHDALADTLLDCCAVTRVGADLWHPRDEVINAILDKFLPDHDKRVRAEQRKKIITTIDASPAVTWTGKGGVRERIAATQEASDD